MDQFLTKARFTHIGEGVYLSILSLQLKEKTTTSVVLLAEKKTGSVTSLICEQDPEEEPLRVCLQWTLYNNNEDATAVLAKLFHCSDNEIHDKAHALFASAEPEDCIEICISSRQIFESIQAFNAFLKMQEETQKRARLSVVPKRPQ